MVFLYIILTFNNLKQYQKTLCISTKRQQLKITKEVTMCKLQLLLPIHFLYIITHVKKNLNYMSYIAIHLFKNRLLG